MISTKPLIEEWHTSDLLSRCAKRVQLKHEGKALPEIGTAMLRGTLFHAIAEAWHRGEVFDLNNVLEGIRDEGRELTPAAARDIHELVEEVSKLVDLYIARFGEYFKRCKVLGVEVPVRWSTKIQGQTVNFASHMDLVFRDPAGALCVWDWKTGDTDWGDDYAARSMQVGMYFIGVQYGAVELVTGQYEDGEDLREWVELQEPPHVSIINVENLKPYAKKTTARDDNGEEREFVKGDERPMRAIAFEVMVNNEQEVIDQFSTRVLMDRAGLWPMTPTDKGCRVCECRKSCPTWSAQQSQMEDSNGSF